eukprot:COSAG04_NODE_17886_length_456_cov_1.689076_1_plen_68_part_10
MERREEAETYHPAVYTQRRQQVVRAPDEVLGVPLVAEHHVLGGFARGCGRLRRSGRLGPLEGLAEVWP